MKFESVITPFVSFQKRPLPEVPELLIKLQPDKVPFSPFQTTAPRLDKLKFTKRNPEIKYSNNNIKTKTKSKELEDT